VPSRNKEGKPIKQAEAVEHTQQFFNNLCGGCTTSPAIGSWTNSEGKLINEDVSIVYAFSNKRIEKDLVGLAEYIKQTYAQESVAIEHSGVLEVV